MPKGTNKVRFHILSWHVRRANRGAAIIHLKKIKMSIKEQIITYLHTCQPEEQGPTEIGLGIGKSYNAASSSVYPALKQLCEQKIVGKTAAKKYFLLSRFNIIPLDHEQ